MTPDPTILELDVRAPEAGVRIDRFLGHRLYPAWSRSFLTGLIASGRIQVNGQAVRPAYRLGPGDRIRAELTWQTESSPEPEDLPLNVLHEDEFLLVIDKPAGLVVHPGPNIERGTLVNALLFHYPEIARVGVVFRPGIVHRLDGYTSGIMVVARTNHARMGLVEQFKTKQVRKEYRAITVGTMPFDSDYIDLPLGPDPKRQDRQAVLADGGKSASTYYEVIERLPNATFVRVQPFTGRTHQIRVHLAHIGFPIVADPLYGRREQQRYFDERKRRKDAGLTYPTIKRHALHAFRLRFDHPVTGESMEFEAPLPEDMATLLEYYRRMAEEDAQ